MQEFNGNSGRNDIVKHSLKEYASARFIRFQPTNYMNHKALRVEVFGILISAGTFYITGFYVGVKVYNQIISSIGGLIFKYSITSFKYVVVFLNFYMVGHHMCILNLKLTYFLFHKAEECFTDYICIYVLDTL